mmetsp:Transcript_10706/g.31838  ORF Transcript_10706/g.31838 Transcript_10706/m.31838 type:complete len:427 (+) Transcript_10706:2-1282(+)
MVPAVAKPMDRMPQIPAAGVTMFVPNDSAANSMRPTTPPATPDDIHKWRKSSIHAPGTISKHPGYVDDKDHLRVQMYGKKSDEGIGVQDLMQTAPKSHIIERALEKKEAIYQSSKLEPLGVAMTRGHELPENLANGEMPFGKGTPHNYLGMATKTLLAPVEPPEALSESVREQYKKSHASYAPGEQRRRNYSWNTQEGELDPSVFRFGKPGDATEHNAIYYALHPKEDPFVPNAPTIMSKALEDYKEVTQEQLGKPKPVGHGDPARPAPEDGFGMPSKRKGEDDWNARQCLEGQYTLEMQRPDVDLGCAVRPGWRNIQPEDDRSFGIPNIRTDVRPPVVKSVADHQNYGNEPTGGEVIAPSHFSQLDINEGDFLKAQSLDQIKSLFHAINTPFGDDVLEDVYNQVSAEDEGVVSIASFRAALFDRL